MQDALAKATCAVTVDGTRKGTAWLFTDQGYLLTAGHLLPEDYKKCKLSVLFLEDRHRDVSCVYRMHDPSHGIDCAILRLDPDDIPPGAVPVNISLEQDPQGTFCSRGYGSTLKDSSPGSGTFNGKFYPQDNGVNALLRLNSTELAEKGFSGSPILCEALGCVVAIQIESGADRLGAGRDTVLAMPLWRVQGLWPLLRSFVAEESSSPDANASDSIFNPIFPNQNKPKEESFNARMHGFEGRVEFVYQPHLGNLMSALEEKDLAIALVGPSGAGKSHTAIEAAYRMSEGESAPKDLVWVSLGFGGQATVGMIINRLATYLDFSEITQLPDDKKVEVCLKLLSQRSVLLILDNVEASTPLEVIAFVRRFPSTCRALITTTLDNDDLLKGFRRVMVDHLQGESAIEFGLHYASRLSRPPIRAEDLTLLHRLVSCTGGSPKAIILLVGAMRFMPPTVVLSEVESASEELAPQGQTGPFVQSFERFHTPIWKRLSNSSQQLLAAATIFRNAATHESLVAASGLTYSEMVKATEELVGAFLLDPWPKSPDGDKDEYRYKIHQSTYLFVVNILSQQEFDYRSAILRLAQYFLSKMRAQPEDAGSIEPDVLTLIAVTRWCSSNSEQSTLIDLAMASYDLFLSLGLYSNRIEIARLATEAAIQQGEKSIAAHLVTVSASTETMLSNFTVAEAELHQGMELALSASDNLRVFYMKRCIAFNFYRQGRVVEAARELATLSQDAISVVEAEVSPDRKLEAQHAYIDILALESAIRYFLGDLDLAKSASTKMLAACKVANWQRAISYPLRDLAEIELVHRKFRSAEKLLNEAFQIAQEFRDYRQVAKIHISFVKLGLHKGNLGSAQKHFLLARKLLTSMDLENELIELEATYFMNVQPKGIAWLRRLTRCVSRPKPYYGDRPIGGE